MSTLSTHSKKRRVSPNWAAVFASGVLLLSGCGQQAFVAANSNDVENAPGTFAIPAKVDILLVEQDLGKMTSAYPEISAAMPGFLTQVQGEGWDYHFVTIPLTTFEATLNQVVASQYDSNWGTQWISPFPGAAPDGPGTIPSNLFSMPTSYQGFLNAGQVDTQDSKNSVEPGFQNITNSLLTYMNQTPNTNFLRSDAMLAVIVISAGDDTSLINYCPREGDGLMISCDDTGAPECTSMSQWGAPGATCASGQVSLNYYQSLFQSMKSSSKMVQFYSVVAGETVLTRNCLGDNAYLGTRYQQMSQMLNGQTYDLCSGASAIPDALTALSSNLQSVRVAMRTRYLLLSQQPDVSTIVVTLADGTLVPQDPDNGWSYAGFVTNGYQIDYPVPMNEFSDYAVQLNGSAELEGGESAVVTYTPLGLHSTTAPL